VTETLQSAKRLFLVERPADGDPGRDYAQFHNALGLPGRSRSTSIRLRLCGPQPRSSSAGRLFLATGSKSVTSSEFGASSGNWISSVEWSWQFAQMHTAGPSIVRDGYVGPKCP